MLQKISIITKNPSNKNCSELNILQQTQRMHIFISTKNGASGLQQLLFLKYYNVLEWESEFTLR